MAGSSDSSPALSSSVSDVAVATAAADDDACLRWELLKVMCFLSGTRGEVNKNPPFSLYRCLTILTKAFVSPLTIGAVRTLILYFKVVILRVLASSADEERIAVYSADLASAAAMAHDCSHCPFYSLCFHVIGQVHLHALTASDTAERRIHTETMLARDLDVCEKVSAKWEFGSPIIQNLHARIIQKFLQLKRAPTHPLLAALLQHNGVDPTSGGAGDLAMGALESPRAPGMHDEPGLSAADRARAATIYTSSTVPVHRPTVSALPSLRIGGPGIGASSSASASIADTVASINKHFGQTLRLTDAELIDMQQLRKTFTTGTHAPGNSNYNLPSTSRNLHLQLSPMTGRAAAPQTATAAAASSGAAGGPSVSPLLLSSRGLSSDGGLPSDSPRRLDDLMMFADSPLPGDCVAPPVLADRWSR